MSFLSNTNRNPDKAIILAFMLPVIYWIYLFFTASMHIKQDAIIFEKLGALIYRNGWIEFFKGGLPREPLYPFLVSLSIRIAERLPLSYQHIQAIFQLGILFTTQILSLFILRMLKIGRLLISITILYIGFSPALVNSAFSLYPEIASYPLVLGIILISAPSWKLLPVAHYKKIILPSILVGIIFALAVSAKGAFEYIYPFYLLPFIYLAVRSILKKQKKTFVNSILYVCISILSFSLLIIPYKFLNYKYSGRFAFTNRGAWMFYGSTAKRISPITPKRFLAGVAFTAGDKVCHKLFEEGDCSFWSFQTSDGFGMYKLAELQDNKIPANQIDPMLMSLAKDNMLKKPLQYLLVTCVEGMKMVFWESTKLGFVRYPKWLTAIYDFTPFKNSLRLLMSLLTFLALCFLIFSVWKNRADLLTFDSPNSLRTQTLFFILIIISLFIALYSFFSILTRYALPIVPLYLIAIAYMIQSFLDKRS